MSASGGRPGLRLSVLDQSPVISGHTPGQALRETLRLAQAVEALGYHRYWLAEHHSMAALADPCPEILLTRLAAETSRLRVGTGGVLLPYYSPFKIAEQFRMLEALYPGRIDLGIGRAPGGDRMTALAIGGGQYPDADDFPERVQFLVAYLDDALPAGHPFARVKVMPEVPTAPQVWLLGSSDYSAALASQLGLRFAFAHFISADEGAAVTRRFRDEFRPSQREAAPHSIVCASVICAETTAEAERLAAAIDLRRLNQDRGLNAPVPNYQETAAARLGDAERARIAYNRRRLILGNPAAVRERLLELQQEFSADEVMIVTITGTYEARLRSYELVAAAFGMPG